MAALAGVPEEVTSRAKRILKKLEKNDVVKRREEPSEETEEQISLEQDLKELNLDLLTPMQALAILSEWKEKLK